MTTHAVDAAPLRRWDELAVGLAGAAAGSSGIVLLYREPAAVAWVQVLLLAALLARWHRRADLAGLLVGAALGNLTEFLMDVAGVWVHHNRDVAGVSPLYIFICYPILLLALPRLLNPLVGQPRPLMEGSGRAAAVALLLWAAHVGASFLWGTRNAPEAAACVVILGLVLWQFHSAHDVASALFGAVLALVWELPATATGAWHFPAPQVLGLVPAWLPLAYAIFFVTLGRITAWLCALRWVRGDATPAAGC
ncbi:MAG: hypothetical protein HY904_10115 [Deltaproteobacteria bacterium]|nr:hypothetical protein [Deltaproteobacteria bacterium]